MRRPISTQRLAAYLTLRAFKDAAIAYYLCCLNIYVINLIIS